MHEISPVNFLPSLFIAFYITFFFHDTFKQLDSVVLRPWHSGCLGIHDRDCFGFLGYILHVSPSFFNGVCLPPSFDLKPSSTVFECLQHCFSRYNSLEQCTITHRTSTITPQLKP
jgi:hypothetical protein